MIDTRKHYVYIVRCADDTLYTGYSLDVPRRVVRHNSGGGAKYTRARLPVVLQYQRQFNSYLEAVREEIRIKKLSHDQKENLIKEWNRLNE